MSVYSMLIIVLIDFLSQIQKKNKKKLNLLYDKHRKNDL